MANSKQLRRHHCILADVRIKLQLMVMVVLMVALVLLMTGVKFRGAAQFPLHWGAVSRASFLSEVNTGDLLIFSCRQGWLTRFTNGKPWTHVGLIYRHADHGVPYLWEMTNLGTRMMPLREYLSRPECRNGKQRIAWRPLRWAKQRMNEWPEWLTRATHQMEHVICAQWNSWYDFDVTDISYLRRFFPGLVFPVTQFSPNVCWGQQTHRARTCTHLTAEVLQALGVVDYRGTGLDPQTNYPMDFARDPWDYTIIPLQSGFTYDEPIWVSTQ